MSLNDFDSFGKPITQVIFFYFLPHLVVSVFALNSASSGGENAKMSLMSKYKESMISNSSVDTNNQPTTLLSHGASIQHKRINSKSRGARV